MSTESTGSDRSDRSMSLSVVFGTMADTTWRIFVPVVGLTLFGVWLDRQWHTKPWLMFAGVIVGALCAVVLVKRQIERGKHV